MGGGKELILKRRRGGGRRYISITAGPYYEFDYNYR